MGAYLGGRCGPGLTTEDLAAFQAQYGTEPGYFYKGAKRFDSPLDSIPSALACSK